MNSITLKEAALYWLRFDKKMSHVCTEFGRWSADVFGASETRTIEIETKISGSDLRADFHKNKHRIYHGEVHDVSVPNYFFFLVPTSLEKMAVDLCEDKGKRYGVIVYDPLNSYWSGRWKVAKRSKRLHGLKPTSEIFSKMAGRMSTEIVAAHMLKNRVDELRGHVSDELKKRFLEPDSSIEVEEEVLT